MQIHEFITKWEVNKSFLARKLGITKQAFNQKVSGKNPYEHFTEAQTIALKKLFLELSKDIGKIK